MIFFYIDEKFSFLDTISKNMIGEENSFAVARDAIKVRIESMDSLIAAQLNEILHHPSFKELEAAWCGLRYLVNEVNPDIKVKVQVLNVSKRELLKDLKNSMEIEQSELFKQVLSRFDKNIRSPFGILIGDYEFGCHPQDTNLIKQISKVAAAALAPFIAGVSPGMFGWDQFEEITDVRSASKMFELPWYKGWRNFRESKESCYAGLCLPHILLRDPHKSNDSFDFQESCNKEDLLWGNSAFAFVVRVAKAYKERNWLGNMERIDNSGMVKGLHFQTSDKMQEVLEESEKCPEFSLDAKVRKWAEDLSFSGFIPLIDITEFEELYNNPYWFSSNPVFRLNGSDIAADADLKGWGQMENILAISRFAINIMYIWRDPTAWIWNGFTRNSYFSPKYRQTLLQNWLNQYVQTGDEPDEAARALRPLGEANIEIKESWNKLDVYKAILTIKPVYLLEDLPQAMQIEFDLPEVEWNKNQNL